MQYAICTDDGKVWEAEQFAALPVADLESKRRNLICRECEEFAWFRKESRHGHPAHFCAHHKDDCDLRVEYVLVDDQRNDATISEEEVAAGDTIIVQLDKEKGGEIDVTEVQAPPTPGEGSGGRTFVIHGEAKESAQHFTLRRILLRLVQSPDFYRSARPIVLYRKEEEVLVRGPMRDVAASFEEITEGRHTDGGTFLFWGPIASAGRTNDGKVWLNSSDRHQGASIAVFEDVAEEFLEIFGVKDLESLGGAHVLVAGKCRMSQSSGKPVIWCGSPKYIVLRRYRNPQLQAEL